MTPLDLRGYDLIKVAEATIEEILLPLERIENAMKAEPSFEADRLVGKKRSDLFVFFDQITRFREMSSALRQFAAIAKTGESEEPFRPDSFLAVTDALSILGRTGSLREDQYKDLLNFLRPFVE